MLNDFGIVFGAIADDVTGGSDLAGALSERGVRTLQLLGLQPDDSVLDLCSYQAVVISLKSRSLPADDAKRLSAQAFGQLKKLRPKQIQFKYCSTFDSTREGNIGPVIEELMDALSVPFTVAVPALPVNQRTQYLGHLFVGPQLLSESPMQHHPLNPMTDSNLVRHLQFQTTRKVGLISHGVVRSGADSIHNECSRLKAKGVAVGLVDATCDQDLQQIAEAVVNDPMITGGSGLPSMLPDIWARKGWISSKEVFPTEVSDQHSPVLIISGSCSAATREQIVRLRESGYPAIQIDVHALLTRGVREVLPPLLSRITQLMRAEAAVLVFSSADFAEREKLLRDTRASGLATTETHSLIEHLFGHLAREAVQIGLTRRLIIAGGETAGAVVQVLNIQAAEVLGTIEPGVPRLKSVGGQSLALVLKSGNFGGPDFFRKAIRSVRQISFSEERTN